MIGIDVLGSVAHLGVAPRIAYVGQGFANGEAVAYPAFQPGDLAFRFNGHTATAPTAVSTGYARLASPFSNSGPNGRRQMWTRTLIVGDTDTTTTGVSHAVLYRGARIKVGTPVALGADPFTFNATTTVTVAHTGHGYSDGDVVIFAGAAEAQGVTPDGAYTVTNASTDAYDIVLDTAASGSGSGGGSDVTEALSSVKVRSTGTANTTVVLPAQTPGPGERAFGNYWTRETQTATDLRAGLPAGATERVIRANINASIHFDSPAGWAEGNITVASSIWCAVSGILAPTL